MTHRGPMWVESEDAPQRTPEQKLAIAIMAGAEHDLTTEPRARSKGESLHQYVAYLRHLSRDLRDAVRFFARPTETECASLAASVGWDAAVMRQRLQPAIRDALHRARHIDQNLVPAVLRHIEATRRPPGRPRKERKSCVSGNVTAPSKAAAER